MRVLPFLVCLSLLLASRITCVGNLHITEFAADRFSSGNVLLYCEMAKFSILENLSVLCESSHCFL